LGIAAAFFFAFTFVLNRTMDLSGGSWIWSASLRYLFMVPLLLLVVGLRRNLRPVFAELRRRPGAWLWWSFVGFGLFYAPLCFAAGYGPGWLIAGTWQITIISGSLLVPLFGEKLPVKGLLLSTLILLGIGLMQFEQGGISARAFWFGVVPVIIASFAYPLGNRKMMALCAGRLDSFQRVLGMTLASLPFWLILAAAGVFTVGAPSQGQVAQSLLVALSSGVVATGLFFRATDMVRGNMHRLAAVEATQSLEVLFTVAAEVLVLRGALPSPLAWVGMLCVVIGMVLHSLVSD
jgi:drug/metabolite transporter (DMT)-like permease